MSSDGSTVAIGAIKSDGTSNGHVRVYQNVGGSWTQKGSDINETPGQSVSLSSDGSTLAIGDSAANKVRLYEYNGGSWLRKGGDIDGAAAGDLSGWSVSLSSDGSTVAVGAKNNGANLGHVRVYQYDGSSWTQKGSDIDGETDGDYSGWSVSLSSDGSTVAISAPHNDGTITSSSLGHARVYKYDGSSWNQLGGDIDGEAAYDNSGYSVSLSSDGYTVAIGAHKNDGTNGQESGHVRVYEYDGSSWTQKGLDLDGGLTWAYFGWSVSISDDGSTVAIGARTHDLGSGQVQLYKYDGSSWTQRGLDIDSEGVNDNLGYSVSLSSSGSIVAIGAPLNDGNGANSGHVRVYEFK